jgi:hypothetical protein
MFDPLTFKHQVNSNVSRVTELGHGDGRLGQFCLTESEFSHASPLG